MCVFVFCKMIRHSFATEPTDVKFDAEVRGPGKHTRMLTQMKTNKDRTNNVTSATSRTARQRAASARKPRGGATARGINNAKQQKQQQSWNIGRQPRRAHGKGKGEGNNKARLMGKP